MVSQFLLSIFIVKIVSSLSVHPLTISLILLYFAFISLFLAVKAGIVCLHVFCFSMLYLMVVFTSRVLSFVAGCMTGIDVGASFLGLEYIGFA